MVEHQRTARPTGSRRSQPAITFSIRQHEIQPPNDFGDRKVAHDRHAKHQPDHLLRRQSTATQGRCSGRQQPFLDPCQIEVGKQRA
jgi:hypothetical protein